MIKKKDERLDYVHKAALYFIEDKDTECHDDNGEDEAVGEILPREGACTEEGQLEGLKNRSERIELHEPEILCGTTRRECGQWIDDWGGIHPELNAELNEEGQVTILGGDRGDE